MFEDIIQLQAYVHYAHRSALLWQKRWKLRKLQHEYTLKELQNCRNAESESAAKASGASHETYQELKDQMATLSQKYSKLNDDHTEMREIYDSAMKSNEYTVNRLQRYREKYHDLGGENIRLTKELDDFMSKIRMRAEKRKELTKSRDLELSRYKDQIEALTQRLSQIGALCSAPVSTSQDRLHTNVKTSTPSSSQKAKVQPSQNSA